MPDLAAVSETRPKREANLKASGKSYMMIRCMALLVGGALPSESVVCPVSLAELFVLLANIQSSYSKKSSSGAGAGSSSAGGGGGDGGATKKSKKVTAVVDLSDDEDAMVPESPKPEDSTDDEVQNAICAVCQFLDWNYAHWPHYEQNKENIFIGAFVVDQKGDQRTDQA